MNKIETRYQNSPAETAGMNTKALRENFLIENLMLENQFSMLYSHYDRCIIGSAVPIHQPLVLPNYDNLKSEFFLERRELGIINIGGGGEVTVDGETFIMERLDVLYVGMGSRDVTFASTSAATPARYFLYTVPAHQSYQSGLIKKDEASPVQLGKQETANVRTIYKYIHAQGMQSCQLVMGVTVLAAGSIWNTMPAHVHDRRMEAYFYFDLPSDHVIFHLMGEPEQTRHLVVKNEQAIISPPWSIHSGVGTSNYAFVWAMAGENKDFTDMDFINITNLK